MKKTICFMAFLMVLSACSEKSNENVVKTPIVEVKTVQIERPKRIIPEPSPISMEPVKWNVITKSNFDEKIEKDGVYYALNVENYENLIKNLSQMRGFIEAQKVVIKAYKD